MAWAGRIGEEAIPIDSSYRTWCPLNSNTTKASLRLDSLVALLTALLFDNEKATAEGQLNTPEKKHERNCDWINLKKIIQLRHSSVLLETIHRTIWTLEGNLVGPSRLVSFASYVFFFFFSFLSFFLLGCLFEGFDLGRRGTWYGCNVCQGVSAHGQTKTYTKKRKMVIERADELRFRVDILF